MATDSHSVLWAVQTNLGHHPDVAALRAAVLAEPRAELLPISALPFSDELPDIPLGRPTVVYGSTRLVTNVHRSGSWRPGVFFDEEAFSYAAYRRGYGEHFLNRDAAVWSLDDIHPGKVAAESTVFVRPADDLKAFGGGLWRFGELCDWVGRLRRGDLEFELSTNLVVAPAKEIGREWRLFVVSREVVAGSGYRRGGAMDVTAAVPRIVADFGASMAARWGPAAAYALDIAEHAGDLWVVEANCLNSAGFYPADVNAVVQRVTRLAVRDAGGTSSDSTTSG
jgi:hypothetical protein